jgi:hypothetical protein
MDYCHVAEREQSVFAQKGEIKKKIEKDFSAFLWGRERRLASAARALRAEWENAVAKLYTHTRVRLPFSGVCGGARTPVTSTGPKPWPLFPSCGRMTVENNKTAFGP